MNYIKTKKEYQRRYIIFNYVLKIVQNYNKNINSINIKKDNALYKELFITPKKIITTKEIENAYKIALLEDKVTMAIKLLQLKKEYEEMETKTRIKIQIYHSDIEIESGKEIADYIWQNNSVEEYIKNTNNEKDKHVFLYENGKIEEVDLPPRALNKNKSKTKTIN